MASSAHLKEEGNALFRSKEYEKASIKYSEALALDPKNVVLYTNRSQCYFLLERYSESLQDAKKAIEIDRKFPKAWYRLGAAYEAMKMFLESIDGYLEATTLFPMDNLSEAQKSQKKQCEAGLNKVLPTLKDPKTMPYQVLKCMARAHDIVASDSDTPENRKSIIQDPRFNKPPPMHALLIPEDPALPVRQVVISPANPVPEIVGFLNCELHDTVLLFSEWRLVSVRDDKLWSVGLGRPHITYEIMMDDNAVSSRPLNKRACQLLRRPNTYGTILVTKATLCKWDTNPLARLEEIVCWERLDEAELRSERFTQMRAEWENVKRRNQRDILEFLGPNVQTINLNP